MSKEVKYICDIQNCENKAFYKKENMQVIFTTEQDEGRGVDPYFENVTIDLCKECRDKVLESKKYIIAIGAQGLNDYDLTNN